MELVSILENFIEGYSVLVIAFLLLLLLILLVAVAVLFGRTKRLASQYAQFFRQGLIGDIDDEFYTMEDLVQAYIKKVESTHADYRKTMKRLDVLEERIALCIQKVGIVRYNPFDEVGGNLCFAIAILDENDTGIVLNGIYSRAGSYTYAKQIQRGESKIVLSAEEMQAISEAKRNAYLQL